MKIEEEAKQSKTKESTSKLRRPTSTTKKASTATKKTAGATGAKGTTKIKAGLPTLPNAKSQKSVRFDD